MSWAERLPVGRKIFHRTSRCGTAFITNSRTHLNLVFTALGPIHVWAGERVLRSRFGGDLGQIYRWTANHLDSLVRFMIKPSCLALTTREPDRACWKCDQILQTMRNAEQELVV
jgi:hypothetical protein